MRAIIKRPCILLLDETTSAFDTGSENVVQEALDRIMSSTSVTTIVIAHCLSTIQNADRIAYICDGKVSEIDSHNELMGNPDSKYRRLQEMQNMGIEYNFEEHQATEKESDKSKGEKHHHHHHHHRDNNDKTKHHHHHRHRDDPNKKKGKDTDDKGSDKGKEKKNASRARLLDRDDWSLFAVGSIGAVLAGLMFPGWGVIFAYMIEFLYYPVLHAMSMLGSCHHLHMHHAKSIENMSNMICKTCQSSLLASPS